MEVANGPDDREETGRTTDEVDDDEDLIPGGETHGTLLGLADYDGGDVSKHLEREERKGEGRILMSEGL